jgi:hypothetical protein
MYDLLCAHLYRRAQTSPNLIALKIYPEAHFITALPNMQTDIFRVLFPNFNHAQFHNHASQRHSSVHGLLSRTLSTTQKLASIHFQCLVSSAN